MTAQTEAPVSGRGLLARLYWLCFGNALLMFLFGAILDKQPEFPALLDAACLLGVASLIIVRYIDIRLLDGKTVEGKPATMANWRRYALFVSAVGAGAWLLVRAFTH